MGILLMTIARLLSVILFPIGFLYATIKLWLKVDFKTWWTRINMYCMQAAISIDQNGNTIMQEFFNDILIKKDGYLFGNPDETISSCLGKNKEKNTLTFLGKCISWLLDKIQPSHVEISINDNENDSQVINKEI